MTDQTLTDLGVTAETETIRLLHELNAPVWCVRYLLAADQESICLSPSEMATVGIFQDRLRARKTFIRYLKHNYNLTIEQFDEMMLNQGGMCAICDSEARLVVDHDHSTGKARQLLCQSCNSFLGRHQDSVDLVTKAACRAAEEVIRATEVATRATKAAEYLKKHKTP